MRHFKPVFNNDYILFRDGSIYSNRRKRWLKRQFNSAGYQYYYLYNKWHFIHRLVYANFIGLINKNYEINHLDMNKINNHISNLEAVTHRENINKARQIKAWKTGRKKGFRHGEKAKQKMRQAKLKPVTAIKNDHIMKFKSIHDTAKHFNTYRKKINRCIKNNKSIDGYTLKLK